jgi:hypothetical protein
VQDEVRLILDLRHGSAVPNRFALGQSSEPPAEWSSGDADLPAAGSPQGLLPGAPTDPDGRVKRIRLFISCIRYAAPQAVNHSGVGKTVPLLETSERSPGHRAASASPRQVVMPYPSRCLPNSMKSVDVANNPVILVVASQLLREFLVLLLDR